jgi:hypothetical protein
MVDQRLDAGRDDVAFELPDLLLKFPDEPVVPLPFILERRESFHDTNGRDDELEVEQGVREQNLSRRVASQAMTHDEVGFHVKDRGRQMTPRD